MAATLAAECRTLLPGGFRLDAALTLPLEQAPVTVLFGPSGAGKTTLLRLLAGLERPHAGKIVFRDRTWCDTARGVWLEPQQRRAGLVFQDYALFPHLTVERNVAFAAKGEAAARIMERFGLTGLAGRMPRSISGGEQQRVALARALAAAPDLLLLDEPLSALDAAARVRTRRELRGLLASAGVPSIVVTHDRTEAIALADWMAVMVQGRILQTGPVREVFARPATAQVAEAVGVENILEAEVVSRTGGLLRLAVGSAAIECLDSGESGPVLASIRAEDVALTRDAARASTQRNRLNGVVRAIFIEGALARVEMDCGFPLVALVTAQSAADLDLQPGESLAAVVKTTSVHLIAAG
ncbi:MAG: ABC transporter ATP-binding protein [Bryobacteraceae bacterium]